MSNKPIILLLQCLISFKKNFLSVKKNYRFFNLWISAMVSLELGLGINKRFFCNVFLMVFDISEIKKPKIFFKNYRSSMITWLLNFVHLAILAILAILTIVKSRCQNSACTINFFWKHNKKSCKVDRERNRPELNSEDDTDQSDTHIYPIIN